VAGALTGRTAILTGAASGIGRAIALRFMNEGANVVAADLRDNPLEGGEPTQQKLAELGASFVWETADQASGEDAERLVSIAVERFGRLDIMVPNAAISDGCRLTETDPDSFDRILSVNLRGVYLFCKEAVKQMLLQEPLAGDEARGRIINISSQHGMVCSPSEFSYGISKAGVAYMTRQIAVDYAKDGIVCNAVSPGKVLTGRADGMVNLDYSTSRTPMPRLGRPEDIANAAVFLASAQASYMTGHNLMVDGGWMAY